VIDLPIELAGEWVGDRRVGVEGESTVEANFWVWKTSLRSGLAVDENISPSRSSRRRSRFLSKKLVMSYVTVPA